MIQGIVSLLCDNLETLTAVVERKSVSGPAVGRQPSYYGIHCLRRLIRELAICGKLVSQDSKDEPASELLRRIVAEKEESGRAAGKRRRNAAREPLRSSASLPPSWTTVRLDEVVIKHLGGGTPSKTNLKYWGGDIPWASVKDINTKYLEDTVDKITQEGLLSSSSILIQPGSIIVVTRMGLGKIAINRIPVAINQDLRALRISKYVDLDYCYNFFLTLALEGSGMTVKGIKVDALLDLPFPLPPLAEQRRIVAKIDELMGLCDALEERSAVASEAHQTLVEALLATLIQSAGASEFNANWARLQSHFDALFTTETSVEALKRTILELAVRGKLMPQDPRDAPAMSFLRRSSEAAPDDAGGLPQGWSSALLSEIVGPMDSGWSPACLQFPARSDETWGVLKTTAVQFLEYQAQQNKELPDKLKPRPEAEARPGDLLITRAGPTNRVGICCYVASTRPRLMISDKIIRFRPISDAVSGEFLALALSVGSAAAQLERSKSGMAASQVNVSQAKLKSVVVALPPTAEQERIVSKVNELMRLCGLLKDLISDLSDNQKCVADAIVDKARHLTASATPAGCLAGELQPQA